MDPLKDQPIKESIVHTAACITLEVHSLNPTMSTLNKQFAYYKLKISLKFGTEQKDKIKDRALIIYLSSSLNNQRVQTSFRHTELQC